MSKIALFGAGGAIGNSVAASLGAQNRNYRVVGRNRAELEKSYGNDRLAEIVTWDPDDPASVRQACRDVDTLVYLVGVPYNHFELHPALMKKTLDAAVAEGIERILLIGTVYPYGRPQTPKVTEDHPRDPHTFKGRMRKAQEDILFEAHAEGRIRAAVIRLPDFYGPHVASSFLHSVFEAAAKGGTANMVGPIDVPHEYMYVPDVGPVVLALSGNEQAYGRWWNFAGPGSITQRDIAAQAFELAGRKPKLRIAGKTLLRMIGLFNPFMRELVEMHYLITDPVLMDDSALTRLLGPVIKTSYSDGVRRTFEAYQRG